MDDGLKSRRHVWTDDEHLLLLHMLREGKSRAQVARKLGVSVGKVYDHISVLRRKGITVTEAPKGGVQPVAAKTLISGPHPSILTSAAFWKPPMSRLMAGK